MRAPIARKTRGRMDKLAFDEALAPSAERSIDLVALDDALKDLPRSIRARARSLNSVSSVA